MYNHLKFHLVEQNKMASSFWLSYNAKENHKMETKIIQYRSNLHFFYAIKYAKILVHSVMSYKIEICWLFDLGSALGKRYTLKSIFLKNVLAKTVSHRNLQKLPQLMWNCLGPYTNYIDKILSSGTTLVCTCQNRFTQKFAKTAPANQR